MYRKGHQSGLSFSHFGTILHLDSFDDIRLRELVFFDRVVVLGSISAAARAVGIPKPSASRWLASLEDRVGYPLLKRTTRHVAPTDRGQLFHTNVRELLAAARAARLAGHEESPSGTLRVSMPVPLGRLLAGPVIASFREALPDVRLEIALQNERVDLVRDRFDVAIRGGPLPDSQLVARRLAKVPLWLYASRRYGLDAPADIPWIAAPGDEAMLAARGPELAPAVAVVDDRSAVAQALVAGAGIGILPAFLGEPARARGDLVAIGKAPIAITEVHAVFLAAQRGDVRLRTLVDLVKTALLETTRRR